MIDKKVFEGVNLQIKRKKIIIKSILFLKEKFRSDGTLDKLESRLVAVGHIQDREQTNNIIWRYKFSYGFYPFNYDNCKHRSERAAMSRLSISQVHI